MEVDVDVDDEVAVIRTVFGVLLFRLADAINVGNLLGDNNDAGIGAVNVDARRIVGRFDDFDGVTIVVPFGGAVVEAE
jgi:hypothetical protein